MGLLSSILDALLPPREEVKIAATMTAPELAALVEPVTLRNARWIHAILPYRSPRVRAMVRAIKFYGATSVLAPLGAVAAEHMDALIDDRALSGARPLVMAPIPSSPARLRTRGYNQADRIARAIHARMVHQDMVAYLPTLLAREDRPTQIRATVSRAENIKGAFSVSDPARIRGADIILIDDVAETGSTLKDARRALLTAGAHDVMGFAIAH